MNQLTEQVNYPALARRMLFVTFPEHDRDLSWNPTVEQLLQRLELDVAYQDLPDGAGGRFYYSEDGLEHSGEQGGPCFWPYPVVVNTRLCRTAAQRQDTVLHECCHYLLHRDLLSHMGRPLTREEEQTLDDQCEKLAGCMMVREETAPALIDRLIRCRGDEHDPAALRYAVNALMERNSVTEDMAVRRMVELGFDTARGIARSCCGERVPDHCTAGPWPGDDTYTISPEGLGELLLRAPALQERMVRGDLVYAEYHLALRAGCVFPKKGKPALTEYARRHIERFCAAFRAAEKLPEPQFRDGYAGRPGSDPGHFTITYSLEALPGSREYRQENQTLVQGAGEWGNLIFRLPQDFREAVDLLLDIRHLTKEKLAELLGVNGKVVYNMLYRSCSLEHLVGLCVVLQLPYPLSQRLLDLAGFRLRNIEKHKLYMSFLLQTDKLTLERCNDILQELNYPPLFRGEYLGILPETTARKSDT